jgi:hypothetical protein
MSNRKKIKKPTMKIVPRKYGWGVYVWRLPNGRFFKDSDGNYLNIPAQKDDLAAITKLKEAAKYYGEPEGQPIFQSGVSRVTDEQYSEQLQRLQEGQIPSLDDIDAIADAQAGMRQYGSELNE